MKKNIENEEQFKYLIKKIFILISSCKMIPSNDNEKNKSENIENIVYFSSLLKQIVLNDYFEKIIDKILDENQIKNIDVNKKILENTKITLKNLEKLEDIKFNFEKEEENKKYKEIIKVIENWKETYEKFESSLKDLYSTKANQLELRKIERIRRN
jgi:CO dehydrogenase/acetyl-CoA synthase beta subunit